MKTLVLVYSFSGNSTHLAQECAQAQALDLCEVRTEKKVGVLKAYSAGCVRALRGKGLPIVRPALVLADYGEAQVFAPVWAGCIAPPMVSALQLLPKGTVVHLHLVSASGSSSHEKNAALLDRLGLDLADYEDLRA